MARKFTKAVIFVTTEELHESYKQAARLDRRTLSEWIRMTLAAAMEGLPLVAVVTAAETAHPPKRPPGRPKKNAEADRLRKLALSTVEGDCLNRLPKGAFCSRCGRIHK